MYLALSQTNISKNFKYLVESNKGYSHDLVKSTSFSTRYKKLQYMREKNRNSFLSMLFIFILIVQYMCTFPGIYFNVDNKGSVSCVSFILVLDDNKVSRLILSSLFVFSSMIKSHVL